MIKFLISVLAFIIISFWIARRIMKDKHVGCLMWLLLGISLISMPVTFYMWIYKVISNMVVAYVGFKLSRVVVGFIVAVIYFIIIFSIAHSSHTKDDK